MCLYGEVTDNKGGADGRGRRLATDCQHGAIGVESCRHTENRGWQHRVVDSCRRIVNVQLAKSARGAI